MPNLESIIWKDNRLSILDQKLLPVETKYVPIDGIKMGHLAISSMQVCVGF